MLKVTTESGAIYYIEANTIGAKVLGGSKDLQAGQLWRPLVIGNVLHIHTPGRLSQTYMNEISPYVTSTCVISIETVFCSRCNDTGECDSGATDMQGNWIKIECECQREIENET